MQIGETLSVALEALRANKLRSFLTMLGIVIGVAAVIAMVALGRGAQQSVKERISSLGTTLLTVMPGQQRGTGRRRVGHRSRAAHARRRRGDRGARARHVAAVQPEMTRQLQVQYENRNTNTTIVGTTANYLEVRKFTHRVGRMFTLRARTPRAGASRCSARRWWPISASRRPRRWSASRSGSTASSSRWWACSRPRARAAGSRIPTTRCWSRSRPRATG